MTVFPEVGKFAPRVPYTAYQQMSHVELTMLEEYQNWRASDHSSMLFISGGTSHLGKKLSIPLCWLSPAAIYITEELQEQDKKVAFFSCQPSIQTTSTLAKHVVGSLILQVLRWRPQILRGRNDEFRRLVNGSSKAPEVLNRLIKLLREVISEIDEDTVYIVLDRPDSCVIQEPDSHVSGQMDRFETNEHSIGTMMNAILRLITTLGETSPRVKIAVIVETSLENGDWRPEFLPGLGDSRQLVYARRHWNQRRLTSQETASGLRPHIWSSDSAVTI
jgi:hypothetical protein